MYWLHRLPARSLIHITRMHQHHDIFFSPATTHNESRNTAGPFHTEDFTTLPPFCPALLLDVGTPQGEVLC